MLKAFQILARSFALASSVALLGACGQRGPLFLPTEPAASQRATLPETLKPNSLRTPALAVPLPSAPAPATP
ncbi:hypothetical protein B2J86_14705 [Acidovorax sp. SRB_14]|uniref:LPS translocon maturation chaperone LptM n=1 Tax=unclassified Acidovorax TaxID=2684926 RepID=UPI00145D1DC3|nr:MULTISPECIES: lipoprotein [unclassified Acidovorax]NMM77355.1 hypothetical protein [Acidovorax sp. SRB_24]NMM82162.1 hypothetical protein [Acidovorax sp. SRB_14]NMM85341.1 hypothetical protein [Rhodococcus sp. SRB_17]